MNSNNKLILIAFLTFLVGIIVGSMGIIPLNMNQQDASSYKTINQKSGKAIFESDTVSVPSNPGDPNARFYSCYINGIDTTVQMSGTQSLYAIHETGGSLHGCKRLDH